jgi:hypothetical protein
MAARSSASKSSASKNPRWIHTWTQQPFPVMLVIGREAAAERALFVDCATSRKFPDVRWMEISSLLRRELAASAAPSRSNRSSSWAKQWMWPATRQAGAAGVSRHNASLLGNPDLAFVFRATSSQGF